MAFFLAEAVTGGTLIGLSVANHVRMTGRGSSTTRLSKTLFGPVGKPAWNHALTYTLGLSLGGLGYNLVYGNDQTINTSTTFGMGNLGLFSSSLLMTIASRIGKGDVISHMICGSARTSKRSLYATACFIVGGAIGGLLPSAANVVASGPHSSESGVNVVMPTTYRDWQKLVLLVAGTVVKHFTLNYMATSNILNKRVMATMATLHNAGLLAFGLGVAGLFRPAKVASFFQFNKSWDPTFGVVAFVAILTSYLTFQKHSKRAAKKSKKIKPNVNGCGYKLASTTAAPDRGLILGSLAFGASMGASGLMTGSLFSNITTGNKGVLSALGGSLVGVLIYIFLLEPKKKPKSKKKPKKVNN